VDVSGHIHDPICLDKVLNREIPSMNRTPVVQPVTSYFTDLGIQAHRTSLMLSTTDMLKGDGIKCRNVFACVKYTECTPTHPAE
jgi:hypothetical protein